MGRNRIDQYAVSWAFFLLPYMEETAIYNSWDSKARVDDAKNAPAMRTPIETLRLPQPAAGRCGPQFRQQQRNRQ